MTDPKPTSDAAVGWWAHRGTMPLENTQKGIDAALAAGVDGVEVDLQVSADGVVFLFHDDELDELADASPAATGRARAKTWAQLQKLTVRGGQPIPRLDEVLEGWPVDKTLNLELKAGGEALVSALEGVLDQHSKREAVVLSSFNPHMLRSAKRLGLPRALLIERPSKPWLHARGAEELQVPWVHLEACLIADWVLERYAKIGVHVGAWGAESPAREAELVAMGVRRVISDFRVG